MGAVGLEPTRPGKGQRIFILSQLSLLLFFLAKKPVFTALRIGLSLYPRLYVRVAPVESLHLPKLSLVICHWLLAIS